MKIKDQIMCVLGFGQNDNTFDDFAEEFEIVLPERVIKNCISSCQNFLSSELLLNYLFIEIIRNCLEECEIECPTEPNERKVLFTQLGFSYEINGIASRLYFKGRSYTKKDKLYAAVKDALVK